MKYALALAVLAVSSSVSAFAATNVLVNTSPTETGCAAVNQANPGYFPATSFSFGGSEPSTSPLPGAGAGKLTLQNLVISKQFDNCSGTLITQFITEATIPTVRLLETTTIGATTKTILAITLTNARINSYSLSGAGDGGGQEAINFTFEKACIAAETSKLKTLTTVCYDSATNVVQ